MNNVILLRSRNPRTAIDFTHDFAILSTNMSTITVSKKEYRTIVRNQEVLARKLDMIQRIVRDSLQDEIRSEYAKKLDRISDGMDRGRGMCFANAREMRKYLKSL